MVAITHQCENCGNKQRGRFDGKPLKCRSCDRFAIPCPVCSGEDQPTGRYFRTDDGEILPCHACNQKEIAARERRGY